MHEEFKKRVNDFQEKVKKVRTGQTDFSTFSKNLNEDNIFILNTLLFRFVLWVGSI